MNLTTGTHVVDFVNVPRVGFMDLITINLARDLLSVGFLNLPAINLVIRLFIDLVDSDAIDITINYPTVV